MKSVKIKGYCHICREGIMGNVDTSRLLECGMCVQRRVKHIERLELESQMRIRNRVDYVTATKKAKEAPYLPKGEKKKMSPAKPQGGKTGYLLPSVDKTKVLLRWEDQLL